MNNKGQWAVVTARAHVIAPRQDWSWDRTCVERRKVKRPKQSPTVRKIAAEIKRKNTTTTGKLDFTMKRELQGSLKNPRAPRAITW